MCQNVFSGIGIVYLFGGDLSQNEKLSRIRLVLAGPLELGRRRDGAQCVELKLRWRFRVHSSACPEIYF